MAFKDPAPIKLTELKNEVVRLADDKQDKEDVLLNTSSKNITGAINEINETLTNVNNSYVGKNTFINTEQGIYGGGEINEGLTIGISLANNSIVVEETGIKVNVYDGVDSSSNIISASANSVKTLNDKITELQSELPNKLDLNGGTMEGNISFANKGSEYIGLNGSVGDNDGWRIIGGSSYGNLGELEIATGFDGTQPIYVRQYNVAEYAGIARTLTLLDNNGNTSFPGVVTASKFEGSSLTSDKLSNPVNINDTEFDGSESITTNKWGVPRVLTIGDFTTSIDGSSDITVEKELIGLPTKEEYDLKLDSGGYEGTANDLKNLIDSKPNTEVVAGQGLKTTQVENIVTVSLESQDEGIIVNGDNIKLNVVDNLFDGGVNKALSAEQGRVLKQLIDAIGSDGTWKFLKQSRVLNFNEYIGLLNAEEVVIDVGKYLHNPKLFLDGIFIDSSFYSISSEGRNIITLNESYAKYDVTWFIEDYFTPNIKFSYPTLNLLMADENTKNEIFEGDVIEILGNTNPNDGDNRLLICQNYEGINASQIREGLYLNEIPNNRPSKKINYDDIVNNLFDGGVNKPLSAEQGRILKQLIDEIGTNATIQLFKEKRILSYNEFIGIIDGGTTDITVGRRINNPRLFIDGVFIFPDKYEILDVNTGYISLKEPFSNSDANWYIEEKAPYYIKFSYPTLDLLMIDEFSKSNIVEGDVIEILGGLNKNDGDQRLVICQSFKDDSSVELRNGLYLNEIPNSRPSKKINYDDIINDYSGGIEKVASAESVKLLKDDSLNKISYDDIDNDYFGGTNKVASAESVKLLKDSMGNMDYLPITGGELKGDLVVNGSIRATGNVTAFSDIRLKENLKPIDDCLGIISSLKGYTYNFKCSEDINAGIIAQDLIKVFPNAVKLSEEGYYMVEYLKLIPILINAVNELNSRINESEILDKI